jgi:dihydrofolate synthase/folylpolyglutamate synthase
MDRYRRLLDDLYALEAAKGIDYTLDRVHAACAAIGSPERRFATFHVAGTNGKGSTAAVLEAALRRAGYRVGLYTSPHLVDFPERIRVGGRMIGEAEIVERVDDLRRRLTAVGITPTFFELVTLLAFDVFARREVEVAVVEVGLGGRLDATNVVAPAVTVITSIARDHEEYLGSSLEAIAAEKAGILKPGVPAVIGRVDPPALDVLLEHARAAGAPVALLGRAFTVEDDGGAFAFGGGGVRWRGLTLALRGRFQRDNAAAALMALRAVASRWPVAESAVRAALAEVRWPGRFDVVSEAPLVVLDGAHNPAATAALRAEMARELGDRRVQLVFGVMHDKDWGAMVETLRPLVRKAIVTRPPLARSLDPRALAAAFGPGVPVRVEPEPAAAVAAARDGAAADDDVILVTGSLFLVGAVYPVFLRRLGRRHLFDT